MKNSMFSVTIKMALFLMIASLVMLFITAPASAEWYVSLFSAILMFALVVIIRIYCYLRDRRDKK